MYSLMDEISLAIGCYLADFSNRGLQEMEIGWLGNKKSGFAVCISSGGKDWWY